MGNYRVAPASLILPPQGGTECGSEVWGDAGRQVTPLAAPADWLKTLRFGAAPALKSEPLDEVEQEFWNEPPRYSVDCFRSLPPEPPAVAVSDARRWRGRVAFAAVLCVVIASVGLQTGLTAPSAGSTAASAIAKPPAVHTLR